MEPFVVTSALTAAVSYLSAVPLARAAFRRCYKEPLVVGEIDYLLEKEAGTASELETSYLRLLRDAVRQTSSVSSETEADIQAAITALGEAIDRLPVVSVSTMDTDALRQEAQTLRTEALHSSDAVISESMERHADAVLRRAEANERSALSTRRAAVLRAEIESQIAALRDGIAALGTGYAASDATTSRDLTSLSESARRVATEAVSAADAHAELDAASSYKPVAPSEMPQQIQVGKYN